jgi:hypothetical protein
MIHSESKVNQKGVYTVTIEAQLESIAKSLEVIAAHVSKQPASKLETPEAPKPEAPKPEAPKPEAPKPEAPKPEAPKPEAPKPEAPTVKVEDINKELQAAWARNGESMEKIQELMTSYGVASLKDLSEDKYNEFYDKAKAL